MKVFNKTVWVGGQKLVDDFAARHKVGFCKMPDLKALAASAVVKSSVRAVPLSCLCLGAATKTEDQGSTPKCAAFSASSYAENIIWRRSGALPDDVNPHALYNYAKSVDGDPDGDGTTLDAVLKALLKYGYFPSSCRVRIVTAPFDVKAAVHRYGACLLGLNISNEWYRGNRFIDDPEAPAVGGHAVQCVGYDADGCWIQNSWGTGWGQGGFARVGWRAFNRQFMYGAYLDGVFGGMV